LARSEEEREERLAHLKGEVPTRGVERLPWTLKQVGDLPAELQSPAVASLAAEEAIQRIIAFPPQIQRGWHYIPKQALLFTPTEVIHLIASVWPGQDPQIATLKGSGLLYMRVTLILLYGFMEVVAQGEASPARLGVEFNTVAWTYLSRPVRQFLQAAGTAAGALAEGFRVSPAALPDFEKLPLKFSNGVKIHGLLPGEELEGLVFQPAVWKRWLVWFRKPVLANTLVLLTSRYVAVIEEEPGVEQGWIISHIPRSNISGMQNQPRDEWDEVTVQLERGGQTAGFKILLQDQAARDWRERWLSHGGRWQDLPEIKSEQGRGK